MANLLNILRAMSVVTIFALAATVSMAPDGFDMSAGTLGTFSAYVFAASFLWFGLPLWLAVVVTILFTMFSYLLTMFLILVCKIPDMLATCALQFVHAGFGISVHRWKCRFGRSWRTEMGSKSSGRRYKSTAWGMDSGIPEHRKIPIHNNY